jgi:NifU-like protein involved in Fe-S cluster formation
MLYDKQILELFREPQHAGTFPADVPDIKTARTGNPGQTDVVQLQLLITNNRITAAKFKCSGSVCTVASIEYLLRNIINKPINIALSYSSQELIAALHLPKHCASSALLAIDCLHKVLKNE